MHVVARLIKGAEIELKMAGEKENTELETVRFGVLLLIVQSKVQQLQFGKSSSSLLPSLLTFISSKPDQITVCWDGCDIGPTHLYHIVFFLLSFSHAVIVCNSYISTMVFCKFPLGK